MIELLIGSNTSRNKVIVADTTTIREALEANDIDYSRGSTHLDGVSLGTADFDKSFKDLGVTTKCSLIVTVKADAAL